MGELGLTLPTVTGALAVDLKALPDFVELGGRQSVFGLWLRMLLGVFTSALQIVALVCGVILFPVVWIFPTFVRSKIGAALFGIGYRVYRTEKIGGWIHRLMVTSMHPQNSLARAHTRLFTPTQFSGFRVWALPILADNYAYLIIDDESGEAALVDPSAPEAVLAVAERLGVQPTAILSTHSHHDHAGGNRVLKDAMPHLTVYGARGVSAIDVEVQNGSVFYIGKTAVSVVATPCHTPDSVCFCVGGSVEAGAFNLSSTECVFTGDTLFTGGVGALFHGTENDLIDALLKLEPLPDSCAVYCGHEYANQLLWFAAWIEPRNPEVTQRAHWASLCRSMKAPTVPSTIGWERRTNPWLRAAWMEENSSLVPAVFERLRQLEKVSWWRRQWLHQVPDSWRKPLRYHHHANASSRVEENLTASSDSSMMGGPRVLRALKTLQAAHANSVCVIGMTYLPSLTRSKHPPNAIIATGHQVYPVYMAPATDLVS